MKIRNIDFKLQRNMQPILWIAGIFASGVLLEILLSSVVGSNDGQSRGNMIIMLLYFAAVLIIFTVAARCVWNGIEMTEELEKAMYLLRNEFDKENDDITDFLEKNNIFNNKLLVKACEEFIVEIKNTSEYSEEINVDIEDYINEDLLRKVIKAHYLNQVASTMTALGILGTFLGLTIGLNSFDLSGSALEIEKKIEPLMNGIKVAFHTSICGMMYSILFGFFYRKIYSDLVEKVNGFHTFFAEKVVLSFENGSSSTLYKYQERLCELLENQNKLTTKLFSEEYVNRILNAITPSINEISKSVRTFTDKAREEQLEGLKIITQQFIKELNDATSNSFVQLSELIKSTNEEQKQQGELIKKNYSYLHNFTNDLEKVNLDIAKSLEEFANYSEKITEGQRSMNEYIDLVKQQIAISVKETERHNSLIDIMNNNEKVYSENFNKAIEIMDDYNKELKYQEEQLLQMMKNITDEVNANQLIIQKQYEEAESMKEENQKRILELSQMVKDQIEDSVEGYKKEIGDVGDKCIESMELVVEKLNNTIRNVDHTIESVPELIEHTQKNIEDAFLHLEENLDGYLEYSDKLSRDVVNRWNQLQQYCNNNIR